MTSLLENAHQAGDVKLLYRLYGFSYFRWSGFRPEMLDTLRKMASHATLSNIRNTWMDQPGQSRQKFDNRHQVVIPATGDVTSIGLKKHVQQVNQLRSWVSSINLEVQHHVRWTTGLAPDAWRASFQEDWSSCSLLVNKPTLKCTPQDPHSDFVDCDTWTSTHTSSYPISWILALDDDCRILLWDTPLSTPATPIVPAPAPVYTPFREFKLDEGWVLLMRGDKIHAGAGYPAVARADRKDMRIRLFGMVLSKIYPMVDPTRFHTIEDGEIHEGRMYGPPVIPVSQEDFVRPPQTTQLTIPAYSHMLSGDVKTIKAEPTASSSPLSEELKFPKKRTKKKPPVLALTSSSFSSSSSSFSVTTAALSFTSFSPPVSSSSASLFSSSLASPPPSKKQKSQVLEIPTMSLDTLVPDRSSPDVDRDAPQMVAEVVADYILATMDVQLPVTCAVGRALKYGHKKLLPVYDAKIGPVPPAVSLPLPHAYRAVRIFLSGYMADGQRFPAPKYFYPATAKMVQEYIKDIHRFSPTIKTVMHAIFYYHIKGRPDEPSLNVIFSDGIQADPAVFPFFCAKSDDSVPEETVAKFQRLYGFSLATLRYHITFLNSPKQLTPSMPYDEFLPPASAAALNRKMGAPKKQQSRMEFDLITGMTRFSSPEFTCTMMVVDDKLMLWTNISLGVLQNSQMTISELGTFLTLKIKVPTAREVTPPPCSLLSAPPPHPSL